MDQPRILNRKTLATLAVIFAVALGLRLAVLYERSSGPGFSVPIVDAGAYDLMARQLAEKEPEQGLNPRMFWQPFYYPANLAIVYAFSGNSVLAAKILQAILGAATCCLTFLLALRLLGDRRTALAAAAITALYGPLILFEGELLAAGPAAFWAVTLVGLFTLAAPCAQATNRGPGPQMAAVLGLVGALAVLTRPTFLPFVGVAWLWLLWRWLRKGSPRRAGIALAAGLAAFAAPTLPFAFLNQSVTGHLSFLPGSGGLNSYIGNNPDACATLAVRPGDEWGELIEMPARAGAGGYTERNRYFYGQVLEFARSQPLDFAAGLGAKVLRFLSSRELPRNIDVYFSRGESRLLAALAWKLGRFGFPFGVILPLAVLGLVTGWRRLGAPLVLFLTCYPLAIVLVFVTARYRVPIVPVLAIPAALGAVELAAAAASRGRRLVVATLAVAAGVLLVTLPGPFCEEALDMEADFYYCLGYAQTERGDKEGAITSYQRALASDPDLEQVHYNLGRLEADRDELESAAEHYRQAVRLDSGFARAHNNLGSVIERQGRPEEALEHFSAAARSDPALLPAQRNLARSLLKTGRSQEALDAITAIEASAPDDPEIPFLRGGAYLQTGDLERAEEALRQAAAADPENARVHNDLGTARLGLRDLPGASESFRRAIELDPDDLQAYNNAGAVRAMMGDLEGARRQFEEAVRRAPDYADARYNLASILLRQGETERAVAELREVLRQQPNHARAMQRVHEVMAAQDGPAGPR